MNKNYTNLSEHLFFSLTSGDFRKKINDWTLNEKRAFMRWHNQKFYYSIINGLLHWKNRVVTVYDEGKGKAFLMNNERGFNRVRDFLIAMNPNKDGQCQFSALCHQLTRIGVHWSPGHLRQQTVSYMTANPTLNNTPMSSFIEGSWLSYLQQMRRTSTYGDHLTLQAVANMFTVEIVVIPTNPQHNIQRISPYGNTPERLLPVFYLGFVPEGEGAHYVSLFPPQIYSDVQNISTTTVTIIPAIHEEIKSDPVDFFDQLETMSNMSLPGESLGNFEDSYQRASSSTESASTKNDHFHGIHNVSNAPTRNIHNASNVPICNTFKVSDVPFCNIFKVFDVPTCNTLKVCDVPTSNTLKVSDAPTWKFCNDVSTDISICNTFNVSGVPNWNNDYAFSIPTSNTLNVSDIPTWNNNNASNAHICNSRNASDVLTGNNDNASYVFSCNTLNVNDWPTRNIDNACDAPVWNIPYLPLKKILQYCVNTDVSSLHRLRLVNKQFYQAISESDMPILHINEFVEQALSLPASHVVSVQSILTYAGKSSGLVLRIKDVFQHPKWSKAWLGLRKVHHSPGWYRITKAIWK